jgi:hypothetical protein
MKNPRGMAARDAVGADGGDGADRVHVQVAAAFAKYTRRTAAASDSSAALD